MKAVRDLWYGLDGQPISAEEAGRLLADIDARRVAHTTITTDHGRVDISTVFLVLNHDYGFNPDLPPVLWETMVFNAPRGADVEHRYRTRGASELGHAEVVAMTRVALAIDGAEIIAEESFAPGQSLRLNAETEPN